MDRVSIRPELLVWARTRAGFSADTLAKRFPRLRDWEAGRGGPTLKQLEKFATTTFAPIGYFFLPEPPVEQVPIPDFRTMSGAEMDRPSPDLLDTIYLCQQRQEWFREYARANGERPLSFVGSARPNQDVRELAARIRQTLGFDLEERARVDTWTDALRRFIEQADSLGILVMVSGVVGSNNRRKLDPNEFRGFVLSDDLAPLVFINGADTKAAQMFTLAHELAHVWLGETALSDASVTAMPEDGIERWCNQVAAEILVPLDVLEETLRVSEVSWSDSSLAEASSRLARRFKVSTLVILRRLLDARALSRDQFWRAYESEVERLQALPRGQGGNFYLSLGARASKTFARALVVSAFEGRTSFTEAFRLLGFRKMATFREVGRSLGVDV
jgi:Zn-dependent peptidase ImmA (M78 family)